MLLYDKSGNFIGVSKEELALLGFEDFDEFKSMHNDLAELFLEKPGYIFKFKNFSWIEYVLHSGTPKKVAILELKNGKQIEVDIKITEIFTYGKSDNSNTEILYCIELINKNSFIEQSAPKPSSFQADNMVDSQNQVKNINNLELNETKDDFIHNDTTLEQDSPTDKLRIDSDVFIDDYNQKNNFEESFTTPFEEESLDIQLKTIHATKEGLENIKNDNFKNLSEPPLEETENKDKSHCEYIFQNEDKNSNTGLENHDSTNKESSIKNDETIFFDITSCAQKLDLDLNLIAELIEEYFKDINNSIPEIESYIKSQNENSLKEKIYELKGIADNLSMNEISQKLQQILEAKSLDEKEILLSEFKNLLNIFKKELLL